MERADLGASGFVRAEDARGDARGWRTRRHEKGSSAGWGSFFHIESREGEKDPRRAGTSCLAGSALKWSRRDGSLTIDIRGAPKTGPTDESPTGQRRSGRIGSGPDTFVGNADRT